MIHEKLFLTFQDKYILQLSFILHKMTTWLRRLLKNEKKPHLLKSGPVFLPRQTNFFQKVPMSVKYPHCVVVPTEKLE